MLSESQGDWFNLPWLNMTQYHQRKLQSCSLPDFLCPFRHSLISAQPGPQSELQEDNRSITIPFKGVERIRRVQRLRISSKTWNTSQPLDHSGRNLFEGIKCAARSHSHLLSTKLGGIFLQSPHSSKEGLERGARIPFIQWVALPAGCRAEQKQQSCSGVFSSPGQWILAHSFSGMALGAASRKCQPLQAGGVCGGVCRSPKDREQWHLCHCPLWPWLRGQH